MRVNFDKFWIADHLSKIASGKITLEHNFGGISPHHLRHLRKLGYIEPIKDVSPKGLERIEAYVLTGRGKGYLALSKRWKRSNAA